MEDSLKNRPASEEPKEETSRQIPSWRDLFEFAPTPTQPFYYLAGPGISNVSESPVPRFKRGVEALLGELEKAQPNNDVVTLALAQLDIDGVLQPVKRCLTEGNRPKATLLLTNHDPRFRLIPQRLWDALIRILEQQKTASTETTTNVPDQPVSKCLTDGNQPKADVLLTTHYSRSGPISQQVSDALMRILEQQKTASAETTTSVSDQNQESGKPRKGSAAMRRKILKKHLQIPSDLDDQAKRIALFAEFDEVGIPIPRNKNRPGAATIPWSSVKGNVLKRVIEVLKRDLYPRNATKQHHDN